MGTVLVLRELTVTGTINMASGRAICPGPGRGLRRH